tara:strand:- start:24959 stop:25393 length:435 start_codon:yes stop_codon:yes gene_type:complete
MTNSVIDSLLYFKYTSELPDEIKIYIRGYIPKNPIYVIYNKKLNQFKKLIHNVEFQDIVMHCYRRYEENENSPEFLSLFNLIKRSSNFNEWLKLYNEWKLWESVIYNQMDSAICCCEYGCGFTGCYTDVVAHEMQCVYQCNIKN